MCIWHFLCLECSNLFSKHVLLLPQQNHWIIGRQSTPACHTQSRSRSQPLQAEGCAPGTAEQKRLPKLYQFFSPIHVYRWPTITCTGSEQNWGRERRVLRPQWQEPELFSSSFLVSPEYLIPSAGHILPPVQKDQALRTLLSRSSERSSFFYDKWLNETAWRRRRIKLSYHSVFIMHLIALANFIFDVKILLQIKDMIKGLSIWNG